MSVVTHVRSSSFVDYAPALSSRVKGCLGFVLEPGLYELWGRRTQEPWGTVYVEACGAIRVVEDIEEVRRLLAEEAGEDYCQLRRELDQVHRRDMVRAKEIDLHLPRLSWSKQGEARGREVRAWFALENPSWHAFATVIETASFWETTALGQVREAIERWVKESPSEEHVSLLAHAEADEAISRDGELVVSPEMLDRFPTFDLCALYIAQAIDWAHRRGARVRSTKRWFPAWFFEGLHGPDAGNRSELCAAPGRFVTIDPRRVDYGAYACPEKAYDDFEGAVFYVPARAYLGVRMYIVGESFDRFLCKVDGRLERQYFPKRIF